MKRDATLQRTTPSGAQPTYDEACLRVFAAQAIQSGWPPPEGAARIWAGPGSGAPCAVCRRPIREDEAELEMEFDRLDGRLRSCHVHAACCAAWEAERHSGRTTRAGSRARPVDLKVIAGDCKIRAREKATLHGSGDD